MTLDDIKSNLCYYDERNDALYFDENNPRPEARPKGCSCDNCFYGRDKLALALLALLNPKI